MADKAFIFGDVHGESVLLERLIREIRDRFGDDIDLYSAGDLVDRGPDSKGVIDICIREGVKGVLGNHELWLHQLLATGEFDSFALHHAMQGDKTIQSYGLDPLVGASRIAKELPKLIPDDHKEFILGLPVWRKIECGGETVRIIHAGLKKEDVAGFRHAGDAMGQGGLEDDDLLDVVATVLPSVLMWSSPNMRDPNLHHFTDGPQVFGHRPVREPVITKKWMALDTGCGTCPPYTLSGVILPDREIVQANEFSEQIRPGGFSDL